jgi:hypothetical protein
MSVNPAELKAHVQVISERCFPRSYAHTDKLSKCADYIREQFALTGGHVTNQVYKSMVYSFENVILLLPGTRDSRIVIGAHYDACGDTPGADDNASGVAGLIELARLLAGTDLEHTIELVAYSTEEPPFFDTDDMGSAHHARRLREQDVNLLAMFSLEMIGYFSEEKGSQDYPMQFLRLFYPSRGNYISIIGNTKQWQLIRWVKQSMRGATDLPVYSASVPGFVPGVDFSDHKNYWKYGYPAVMITDTAFYRNRNYHNSGDTAGTLDYEKMSKVVVGVYEAVKFLAEKKDK